MRHVFFQRLAKVDHAPAAQFLQNGKNVAHRFLHVKVERAPALGQTAKDFLGLNRGTALLFYGGKVTRLPTQDHSAAGGNNFNGSVSSVQDILDRPITERVLFVQIAAYGLQRVRQVHHSLGGKLPRLRA